MAKTSAAERKISHAKGALAQLGFTGSQANDLAARTLLALLQLRPATTWAKATAPVLSIRGIIDWIGEHYPPRPAENMRETVRDEVVKHFVAQVLLLKNADQPDRPTNSAKTNYRITSSALTLFRSLGSTAWDETRTGFLAQNEALRHEMKRHRELRQIPVTLPGGKELRLSPGGQNPLIRDVIEKFVPQFTPGGHVLYAGDTSTKHSMMDKAGLAALGVVLAPSAKMPDVVIHDVKRNWLVIVEAVASDGPVDGKRRMELKQLFSGFKNGLVFVTAFEDKAKMRAFLPDLAWETEVWLASDPAHMIHLNGERFLGPYEDTKGR